MFPPFTWSTAVIALRAICPHGGHYALKPLWCVADKEVTIKFPQQGINTKNIP